MRKILLSLICFASFSSVAVEPKIHSVTYKSGATFMHFQFEFTHENIRLPKDFSNRKQLDDSTENFKYGQFEVFIPSQYLQLPQNCKTNYIARMGQTLELSKESEIKEKQELYFTLVEVAQGNLISKNVTFEIYYKKGCNIFFRTFNGKYISYLGKISK